MEECDFNNHVLGVLMEECDFNNHVLGVLMEECDFNNHVLGVLMEECDFNSHEYYQFLSCAIPQTYVYVAVIFAPVRGCLNHHNTI